MGSDEAPVSLSGWPWERSSQPCNGTRCLVYHRNGGLSVMAQHCGAWETSSGRRPRSGVVGWIFLKEAPLASLRPETLAELLVWHEWSPNGADDE